MIERFGYGLAPLHSKQLGIEYPTVLATEREN